MTDLTSIVLNELTTSFLLNTICSRRLYSFEVLTYFYVMPAGINKQV